MKVVITGATGFVGKHLTLELSKHHDVVPLSRHLHACSKLPTCSVFFTDYSYGSLSEILKGSDAVIHLAAKRADYPDNPSLLKNSELDYRVFRAAEECKVKHVVYASTRGVYGTLPAPWHESTTPAPENLYALAKLHGEQMAAYFIRRGLYITTLRFAQVFGLGEYQSSAVTTFIRNAYLGQPISITAKGITREYIYVADLVRAINHVLAKPLSGIFNLGSGECVSLEDMARFTLSAFCNADNLIVAPNPKVFAEYSLMDSSRFRESFTWRPEFSLAAAAKDIAQRLKNEEAARYYGLSVN